MNERDQESERREKRETEPIGKKRVKQRERRESEKTVSERKRDKRIEKRLTETKG